MPRLGQEQTIVAVTGKGPVRADTLGYRLERETGLPVTAFAGVRDPVTGETTEYLRLNLPVDAAAALVLDDAHVFPDRVGHACIYRSVNTIRADIGRKMYSADGKNIVWAVFDSGVDAAHPHFSQHHNLDLPAPLRHLNLMSADNDDGGAIVDKFGHGTCMAGIIAGENQNVRIAERVLRNGTGETEYVITDIPFISGIAPLCRILSVKVLDDEGAGSASVTIQALAAIQNFNEKILRVHGVNMGLGFPFDQRWYACGRSPICIEVDRLVRSGVVVVASAGNTGFGQQSTESAIVSQGMEVSINDPGNAELALTVGSTHRELPTVYGVSYFSSKGPTLDGRAKPDIVAPGERIVSCLAGANAERIRKAIGTDDVVLYGEDSGTSLAAAHASGAAAAVLSARRDLIGSPELLKRVLMESAVNLSRSRFFQGSGMVDVLQALQTSAATQSPVLDEHFGRVTPAAQTRPSPAEIPATPVLKSAAGSRPLRVMYSYAHEDDAFRGELDLYLTPLVRQNRIEIWRDRNILPGSEFEKDIAIALEESDLIILLVTKDYIASDYSWSIELKRALERHRQGTVQVIPIILKPTPLWQDTPFGKLTALPKDGKPITTFDNQDLAWTEVVEEIRRLITSMEQRHQNA